MRAPGNRLLSAFLGLSVVFFAVALFVGEDAPVDTEVDAPAASDVEARREGAPGGAPAMQNGGDPAMQNGGDPAMQNGGDPAMQRAVMDPAVNARAAATVALASISDSTAASPGDPLLLGRYDFDEPDRQLRLPRRLREISGLAMLAGNRLLAHDDERGTVVEINYSNGSIVKDFELGGPRGRVADDFEGIAAAEGWLYLVTSTGRLYEFGEGADGAAVSYNRYETGVGRAHEIEGLAYDPYRRELLLVSKNPRNPRQGDQIVIYRWSLDSRRLVDDGRILIEAAAFARPVDRKTFQPSGIERHPVSGNYFVVAARQRAIAEITPRGKVLSVIRLKAGRHRQAEGITIAADHTLVIADEGAGKRATLSFYPFAKGR
ncbi:MAG: SdiA-regulated domain-containing protein [Rhodospirillaceae bacterium]|nr:SdiA-regulated domain-containing protein [Rhodospirillaceae bacterium]